VTVYVCESSHGHSVGETDIGGLWIAVTTAGVVHTREVAKARVRFPLITAGKDLAATLARTHLITKAGTSSAPIIVNPVFTVPRHRMASKTVMHGHASLLS
jgi:hypothetical protein